MKQNSKLSKAKEAITHFLFAPADPAPLAVFRILFGTVLLWQGFWFAEDVLELYGRDGILQGGLADYMASMALPNIGWVARQLEALNISPDTTVRTTFLIYLGSLVSLILGWHTRVSAFICWLSHFLVIISGFVFVYGVDHFGNIFLFFMIWMPMGNKYSIDSWVGRTSSDPTSGTRLALRVLQFELCVIYVTSGIHKAMGEQWWTGEAIWRAVHLPLFGMVNMDWLAQAPWMAMLMAWATLLIEIGYGIFVWPRRTKHLWVAATVALHIGIALTIGLVSFSVVMAVMTVAVFGVSGEVERPPALGRGLVPLRS